MMLPAANVDAYGINEEKPMKREILDPNLLDLKVSEADVVWHNALDAPFSLHGVYYDKEMAAYRRMPLRIAERVNNGVRYYSSCTSGGRLRFRTSSPYVALCARIPPVGIESNMPLSSLRKRCVFGQAFGHRKRGL